VKFLIDMPLSPELAVWLQQKGHDAVHASSRGLDRTADSLILEIAQRERRVVVTADLDYPRLLAFSRADGPGLVLFRGGNYSEQESLERLARVLEVIPQEELPRSLVVIEKERIRRRWLPIVAANS
jgi:predicted nuclease of predicted toxin-antitoxin system